MCWVPPRGSMGAEGGVSTAGGGRGPQRRPPPPPPPSRLSGLVHLLPRGAPASMFSAGRSRPAGPLSSGGRWPGSRSEGRLLPPSPCIFLPARAAPQPGRRWLHRGCAHWGTGTWGPSSPAREEPPAWSLGRFGDLRDPLKIPSPPQVGSGAVALPGRGGAEPPGPRRALSPEPGTAPCCCVLRATPAAARHRARWPAGLDPAQLSRVIALGWRRGWWSSASSR